jgi:acetyl esterase/lipase
MTATRWRTAALWAVGLIAGAVVLIAIAAHKHHQQQAAQLPPVTAGTEEPPIVEANALLAPDLVVGAIPDYTDPHGAIVIRPRNATGPEPVLIFIHGWGARDPRTYGPWIAHLAREGYYVIFPIYQVPNVTLPSQILANALVGIRGALKVGVGANLAKRGPVVVAGHSAGGTLSADYAAVAALAGLPPARVVYSVYPGVRLQGWTDSITVSDLSKIPASTKLVVLAGADDQTVGEATARKIYSETPQVAGHRLTIVTTPVLSQHGGPGYVTTSSKQTFWVPLDSLL